MILNSVQMEKLKTKVEELKEVSECMHVEEVLLDTGLRSELDVPSAQFFG